MNPRPRRGLTPFLRWPGGKRWFVSKFGHTVPKAVNRYLEPFLGGGALYFYLEPESAILGDINPDVISCFKAVKTSPQALRSLLRHHEAKHSPDYYYAMRSQEPEDDIEMAARTIYLNRTCFNGIYRVNRQGKFNVPIGSKTRVLLDSDDFDVASELLSSAQLLVSDFEPIIDLAQAGDLIYADPPYVVNHNQNGFVKYNERLFSWADQVRLANALHRASTRGAMVVSTNANSPHVESIYSALGFKLSVVSRFTSISGRNHGRGAYEELLIRNFH